MALATVYRSMGKRSEAIEELQKVTEANPQADEAFRLLGQILADVRQFEESAQALRSAIRLRPNYWAYHYSLGVTFYRANRYPEAVSALRRAAELQPDNGSTHQMLGTVYHAMDDTKNAIANYERATRFGSAAAYTNLGVLYAAMGDLVASAKAREEAVRLEPKSAIKRHNLASIYARMGRDGDARREYEATAALCREELRIRPKEAGTLSTLSLTELKLGRRQDAEKHLGEALALDPGHADVRYTEALVMNSLGRRERALAALEKAIAGGFSAARAAKDPELAGLVSDPRFAPRADVTHGQKPGGGGTMNTSKAALRRLSLLPILVASLWMPACQKTFHYVVVTLRPNSAQRCAPTFQEFSSPPASLVGISGADVGNFSQGHKHIVDLTVVNSCGVDSYVGISWQGQKPFSGCDGEFTFASGTASLVRPGAENARGMKCTVSNDADQSKHCQHSVLVRVRASTFDVPAGQETAADCVPPQDHALDYRDGG